MNTYYEYIRSKIKGMISSAYLDMCDCDLDFNAFIEYIEQTYQISESSFNYQIIYNKTNFERDYDHYVTLNNSIYVEIQTLLESDKEVDVIDMDGSQVRSVIAYCSQGNNKELIKFMNVVNTFVTKNKEEINNV